MIFIAFPVGSTHGWGVCGKYVSREMSSLTNGQVRLATQPFTAAEISDELELRAIQSIVLRPEDSRLSTNVGGRSQLSVPLLVAIVDKQLTSWAPHMRGSKTVGYTFFEENILVPEWLENGRRNFDLIATGSTWCTEILKQHGMEKVHTVIQGIDPSLFFPWPKDSPSPREYFRDQFVIFSGGKFELRKGQDLAIRAVKVLQERHPDVFFINAWFNSWQQSVDSMRGSPYIRWPSVSGSFVDVMNRLLAENGMDMTRVLTLGPRANALTPRIYRNTDIGVFPNRCEGGTNLVLMEYMACGKPVVATASTGHADIVRPENALVIRNKPEEATVNGPAGPIARWPEPDLDDVIDKLEWAYQHRSEINKLGEQAGTDLAQHTWKKTAEEFLKLLS